jgi:hypothetical protein
MRLDNYLLEGDSSDIIKRKCRILLGIYKDIGKYFYRGTRNPERFKLIVPRQDRKPMNTPLVVHEFLDELFFDRFGWKPRSSGVFVSPDKREAKAYGPITKHSVVFLATDPFKALWSPKVQDLFVFLHGRGVIQDDRPLTDYQKKKISETVDTYIEWNLDVALNGEKNEVMFKCNGYYLINEEDMEKLLDF